MATTSASTLQLFHVADQEANTNSVTLAPNFSSVLNALKEEDIDGDGVPGFVHTLTLSSGDVWIPGLFYDASESIYGREGVADILIQNELGVQAIAFGNHEFDNGTAIIADLLAGFPTPDGLEPFAGANFPYLSANLDFSGDANLQDLIVVDAQDATSIPGGIAKSTVVETEGGMRVGVVGATTPTIDVISSPGDDVGIRPVDFDSDDPADIDALAEEIQTAVDALLAANPDLEKVILLAHMQQIAIEQALAERLSGVDVIVAGGSNTRLFDENDEGFGGEAGQGVYPILETGADGNPVLIVSTDFQYEYVGRLVIEFDENGVIIPESYDPLVSGAYATDEAGVARVGAEGLADPEIVAIVEAVNAVIVDGESEFYAITEEFLNGERQGGGLDGVRTQETNLGNLTADANLFYMRDVDPEIVVSIKNGGGIRASIGQKFVPGGSDEEVRLPPEEVPAARPEGGISKNAVANTLAFNNGLTLLSLTTEQLAETLEHIVGEFTSLEVDSGMGHVGGVKFSFDPDAPVGDRIVNAGVFDVETDELIAKIVQDGEVVDNGDQTFRTVTLNFLADGGSGYPFPEFEGTNRVDLYKDEDSNGRIDDDAPTSGAVAFADFGEQDALAEYLLANFGTGPDALPFNEADTPAALDKRIQNLNERSDSVFATPDSDVPFADDRRTVGPLDAGEDFRGVVELASGTTFEDTIVGGLSGIVYDAANDVYLAVSDDRGADEDGTPRFYTLGIDLSDGALDEGAVVIENVTALTLADGVTTLDAINPDPEGIAIGPNGELFVSSERDVDGNPAIFVFNMDGVLQGTLPVDAKFLPDAEGSQGVRSNLGFESLTITPDGTTLFTATESALAQDGEPASLETGSPARIVEYDLNTGEAVSEFIYEVEPIANAPVPADAFADSGLVELLAIDNQGTLLALERSFSSGAPDRGFTIQLFLVETQAATDVIGENAIPAAIDDGELEINVDEVARKELLLDLGELGIPLDNLEGMTLGPVLEDGRQSLVLVADDNFGAFGPQANQFITLALDLEDIPTIEPVLETPDELRYPAVDPLVIAHRGASAELPEHTLGAYARAINDGADFIEPDLVITSDGVLIARHEPFLATVETDADGNVIRDADGNVIVDFATTDVADKPEFADRLTTKQLNPFTTVTGWFAEDFTLEEIKTLRAIEDQPDLRPQSALFDGLFEVPTLDEIIDLVQAHEARTGEQIGIYPETKDPTFFDLQGLSLEERLVDTLVEQDFTDPERVFIQSFEIANLLDLQENILPAAGIDLPLVQLLFNAPTFPTVDLFFAQQSGDLSAYASLPFIDETTTSGDLVSPENLETLQAAYAEGIGPSFSLVINADGSETSLVEDAQSAGLLVHGYTHADERSFIAADGATISGTEAYTRLLETGVDGIFTDNPATGRAATDAFIPEEGPDPDDPAIWLHPEDAEASVVITAMKNGGLRVYDLQGQELQRITPDDIRYKNVDVLYGVSLGDAVVDLAVASDRANDSLAVFTIDPNTGLLTDVTSAELLDPAFSIFGVDDGEATAYGLATYRSRVDGTTYAFTTQADGAEIAQLELRDDGAGNVTAEVVRTIPLPVAPGDDPEDYQSEGITVDRETGIVYVTVEDELGVVRFGAEPTDPAELDIIIEIDEPFFTPDLEGISILYGEDGAGALVVSSQGNGTFAAFDRVTYEYLGSFAIGPSGEIDGVEESDGLEIFAGALGGAFPNGLLVTQDGSNEPQVVFGDPEDGEIQNFNVNFKLTDLAEVLRRLDLPAPDTRFDPRAQVEAGTDGDDVLVADADEPQILLGGDGSDLLVGADGFAILRGGDGRDTLLAGDGGARLVGGGGQDLLIGGAGPDSFVVDGDGPDIFAAFDAENDVVELAVAGLIDFEFREVGGNQVLAVDTGLGLEDVATVLGGGVTEDAVVDPLIG